MQDRVEIHEFFIQGADKESSHVLLHISEPSEDEDGKGYFFAVCDIENSTPEMVSHVQKMIDDLESGYYEGDDKTKINAFESSIEHINRRSHHILTNTHTQLHLAVGVIENEKIFFTSRGNVLIHLLYHKSGELFHLNVNEDKKTNHEQIFSSVVEGEILNDDFLVITSEQVEQFYPLIRIEKILAQKDIKSTVFHIQKTLEQMSIEKSLGGVIIHRPRIEDKAKFKKLPKSAKPIEMTLNTSKTFFSSVVEQVAKKFDNSPIEASIFNPQTKPLLEEIEQKHHNNNKAKIPSFIAAIGKGIGVLIFSIISFFQHIFGFIFKIFRFLFFVITNQRDKREKMIHNIRLALHDIKIRIKTLPTLSKILLILSFIAIIAFVSSIVFIRHKEAQATLAQQYTLKIESIKSKRDAAEASLIYNDSGKAFNLLQEAKQIVIELKIHPKKNDTEIANLSTQIENSLMQLRKQGEVPSTAKYDIIQTFANAATEKIIRAENTLIAYGPNDKNYYFINLDTGAIVQKNHDTIPTLLQSAVPKEYDKIAFTVSQNQVADYDIKTDALRTKDIAFPTGNTRIEALTIYNRKLYTLDPTNNQIYKHNQTLTGYDKGTNWIQEPGINLAGAVSVTIDGDIFVLKNNGEILKFTGGKLQPWGVKGLDPALQNPTQIVTYTDMKNIYILEPSSKRVVVLDKNGQLVKQYTSSEWKNPSSITVDEVKKTVYLLDSNKIFEFKL